MKNASEMLFIVANAISEIGYKNLMLLKKIHIEKTYAKISEAIRTSLDFDEAITIICKEIAKLFGVQRVALAVFPDPNDYSDFIMKKDYTINSKIKKIDSCEEKNRVAAFWARKLIKSKSTFGYSNIKDSNAPKYFKEMYKKIGVKSIIGVAIRKGEKVWGTLILSKYNQTKEWEDYEKFLLKILADQIFIVLNQAELYESVKKTAQNEKIIKDILSSVKLTNSLNEAYNILLKKLVDTFDITRALFLESTNISPDMLNIKHEYVIPKNRAIKYNEEFPPICIEEFLELINNQKTLIINDVNKCQDKPGESFFRYYNIQSLIVVPLIKNNSIQRLLGYLVLCDNKVRQWNDDEIKLLKNIVEIIVSAIWEISKYNELRELRSSFISTIAHDVQVPFTGERIALEYLLKNANEENKDIIKELIKNNVEIHSFLNKSVDIYNYEAGLKNLSLENVCIAKAIEEVINEHRKYISNKKIIIHHEKGSLSLCVNADKEEIKKVFATILENAIENSLPNGTILINYKVENKYIICKIHNEGKFIPHKLQKNIFKRYETALSLERKIASGTGLILAKQIVQAHKGHIWFESAEEAGTSFYVALNEYLS